jgi:hypothetical protein
MFVICVLGPKQTPTDTCTLAIHLQTLILVNALLATVLLVDFNSSDAGLL